MDLWNLKMISSFNSSNENLLVKFGCLMLSPLRLHTQLVALNHWLVTQRMNMH